MSNFGQSAAHDNEQIYSEAEAAVLTIGNDEYKSPGHTAPLAMRMNTYVINEDDSIVKMAPSAFTVAAGNENFVNCAGTHNRQHVPIGVHKARPCPLCAVLDSGVCDHTAELLSMRNSIEALTRQVDELRCALMAANLFGANVALGGERE